ncbi:wax ester/triacylglycerol synthase domain-containing protein [Streptomyces sp. TRM 70351]|uniref:wax ester/triacylglycerol synthase domain-containing protein n=1 Tax=Streptomyces sp. TRM 70351 TaxID=3116552 RepID=UPI003FCD1660
MLLEGVVDRNGLVAWHERATHLLPRLRSKTVAPSSPWQPPRWEPEPGFQLERHLRRLPAAGLRDAETLLDHISTLQEQPCVPGRSPWEAYLLPDDRLGISGYVMKLSHSVADGLRLRQFLFRETTAPVSPATVVPAHEPPASPNERGRAGPPHTAGARPRPGDPEMRGRSAPEHGDHCPPRVLPGRLPSLPQRRPRHGARCGLSHPPLHTHRGPRSDDRCWGRVARFSRQTLRAGAGSHQPRQPSR